MKHNSVMESPIIKQIEAEAQTLSQAEVLDLVVRLTQIARSKGEKHEIDWSRYAGVLKLTVDPLEYQRQIRSEWD